LLRLSGQNICSNWGRADYDPLRAKRACEKMCGSVGVGQRAEFRFVSSSDKLERIGRDGNVADVAIRKPRPTTKVSLQCCAGEPLQE